MLPSRHVTYHVGDPEALDVRRNTGTRCAALLSSVAAILRGCGATNPPGLSGTFEPDFTVSHGRVS